MGDLRRHAEIVHHVRTALARIRPDEDYAWLALGNYLTDVSQVRDPVAHLAAKRTVRAEARGAGAVGRIGRVPVLGPVVADAVLAAVHLDTWLDALLGSHRPASARHGALAAYLTAVVEGVTHAVFADDVPRGDLWRAMVLPQLGALEPIPSAEVERALGAVTQYFPHEHVDRPPSVPGGEHAAEHAVDRRGPRGLSAYLEEDIDCLAESLTAISVDWRAAGGLDRSDPRRHDVLLRLGAALHGVEDFFFHSNQPELHLWHSLRLERPDSETEDEYRAWFAQHVASRWLPGDPSEPGPGEEATDARDDPWRPSTTHQVRALLRRLRHPGHGAVDTPAPRTSESAVDHLYTGGFGSADLFHTLGAALEGLESAVGRSPAGLRGTDLVLLRVLVDRTARSRMARDRRLLDAQVRTHRGQLASGAYQRGIDLLLADGYLNGPAAAAWHRAVAVDSELDRLGAHTPGVGGFLIGLLARAQGELEASRERSRALDDAHRFGPGDVFDVRPDDGASGEHVGTHALMAKDSDGGVPLHEEARRLARFASTAVATILTSEVARTTRPDEGLDWGVVLRHYLRFPTGEPSGWESQVLAFVRTHAADPTFDQIPDAPATLPAAGPQGAAPSARRRAGSLRSELERRYVALEERVDGIGPPS